MIQIEVTRYTISKLEEAIKKYNNSKEAHFARITEYTDIINKALEEYLKVDEDKNDIRNTRRL